MCEGAGVGRVLIRDRGAAPLTPTVVAASAGATEWLEVERVTNTVAELERLKEEGFWIYGAAEGGVPPWEIDLTGPIVLCFGGEEKGLRRLTRETLRSPGRSADARPRRVAQRGHRGGGAALRGGAAAVEVMPAAAVARRRPPVG